MQQLEIAVIVILVIGLVVAIVSARSHRPGRGEARLTRVGIGLLLGVLGAVVFLAPQVDVVPDVWQGPLEPILIGGITLLLILGSVYRTAK